MLFMEVLCVIVEILCVFMEVLCVIVEILCIFMEVFSESVKFCGFVCIYDHFVCHCLDFQSFLGGFVCICKKHLTCVHTESINIRTSDR